MKPSTAHSLFDPEACATRRSERFTHWVLMALFAFLLSAGTASVAMGAEGDESKEVEKTSRGTMEVEGAQAISKKVMEDAPDVEEEAQKVWDDFEKYFPGRDDLAYQMLYRFFGEVVSVVYRTITGDETYSENAELTTNLTFALGVFSSTVLIVGGFIVGYITFVSVIKTGQDGDIFGQKWDSFWVPMRTFMSISLVVPIPGLGNLSGIQAIVLGIIMSGVAGANMIWGAWVDSSFRNPQIAESPTGGNTILGKTIFQSKVCSVIAEREGFLEDADQRSYNLVEIEKDLGAVLSTPSGVEVDATQHTFGYASIKKELSGGFPTNPTSGKIYELNSACGSMSVRVPDANVLNSGNLSTLDLGSRAYIQSQAEIPNLVRKIDKIMRGPATKFVDKIEEGKNREAYEIGADAIVQAQERFNNKILDALNKASSDLTEGEQQYVKDLKSVGFVAAGALYWELGEIVRSLGQARNAATQHSFSDPQSPTSIWSWIGLGEDNETMDAYFAKGLQGDEDGDAGAQLSRSYIGETFHMVNGASDNIQEAVSYEIMQDGSDTSVSVMIMEWFGDVVNPPNEPVPMMALQEMGYSMVNAAAMLYAFEGFFKAMTTAGAVASGASEGGPGLVATIVGSPVISGLIDMIFTPLMAVMLIVGLLFGYAIPAIPIVMWIIAMIGLGGYYIGAMIASPIWAMMHALPDGEGLVSSKGSSGYMILLSLLLRPSLMVMGLMAAMSIFNVASWIINQVAYPAIQSMLSDVFSPVNMLVVPVMLGILYFIAAMKSFQFISEIGDDVLKWIGGGDQANLGDQDAQNRTYAMAGMISSNAGSGLQDGASKVGEGMGGGAGKAAGAAKRGIQAMMNSSQAGTGGGEEGGGGDDGAKPANTGSDTGGGGDDDGDDPGPSGGGGSGGLPSGGGGDSEGGESEGSSSSDSESSGSGSSASRGGVSRAGGSSNAGGVRGGKAGGGAANSGGGEGGGSLAQGVESTTQTLQEGAEGGEEESDPGHIEPTPGSSEEGSSDSESGSTPSNASSASRPSGGDPSGSSE